MAQLRAAQKSWFSSFCREPSGPKLRPNIPQKMERPLLSSGRGTVPLWLPVTSASLQCRDPVTWSKEHAPLGLTPVWADL